jgi:hypothetical protein
MKSLERIAVIRQSLGVFICAVIGLVPAIGLFPATYALVRGYRIRRAQREFNPAGNYLRWGITLAVLGILFSFVFALMIGLSIVSRAPEPGYGSAEDCF